MQHILSTVLVEHEESLHLRRAHVGYVLEQARGELLCHVLRFLWVEALEHLLQLVRAAVANVLFDIHSAWPDQGWIQPGRNSHGHTWSCSIRPGSYHFRSRPHSSQALQAPVCGDHLYSCSFKLYIQSFTTGNPYPAKPRQVSQADLNCNKLRSYFSPF